MLDAGVDGFPVDRLAFGIEQRQLAVGLIEAAFEVTALGGGRAHAGSRHRLRAREYCRARRNSQS